jgi:hypothetical protein
VKEIHANPQPVLDAIASGVAYDPTFRTEALILVNFYR